MINSLKDNFGFIERADVVREIFFHVSEMNGGDSVTPHLGDDVEFTIQTRNGKEVACSITILPSGTVVFEDVGTEWYKGQVGKNSAFNDELHPLFTFMLCILRF